MSTNLLATKLFTPPSRRDLVPRPRLIQILNDAWQQDKKLALVSAGAGYGKTTLVTEWLRGLPAKTAWLSLDEADNDPARFLAYFIAALQQIDGHTGENTRAMLQSPQPFPPEVVLTSLINEITAVPTPFILVLDDYHVIQTLSIHQQLCFMVENQPPSMRLVIITREDPPLPLARLRARGQMVEIRQDDLRFLPEECADFLVRIMNLNLSAGDIDALERRTEGWIAGLQLAGLSMHGCDDPADFIKAFTGSSHYVLDYLIEEVFERQSAEEQDFLLKTSILDRLTGPLCDAVVADRSDSRLLLNRLERANLFIIALDQSRTWYRYHHLFAELLRQRLHSAGIVSENELHRRASQWFAAQGLQAEAIQHALAAADWENAAGLIKNNSVDMLRRGEVTTLLGWIRALPDEVLRNCPQLCGDYGWALTLAGYLDAAAPYLDYAERAAQGDAELLGQIIVAQAYLARSQGDFLRAITLSKRALELVAETDILQRSLIKFTLGFALLNSGQFTQAETALLEACEAARASGNDFARLTALGLLGAIQKIQGRLHRGAEFCRQAIEESGGSPAAAQVRVILASILYEWNDLEAASDQLTQALKASQSIGNRTIQPEIYRLRAQIQQARGDFASALDLLDELNKLVQGFDSPIALAFVAALHADLTRAQGDILSASRWAQRMTEGIDPAALGMQYGLTQARLLLAQEKPLEAEKILVGMYESVSKTGMVSSMIEIRALQALAAATPNEALHFLGEAMKMAQPEGFARTFLDNGEPMKALLERMKAQGGDLKPYVMNLLAAFGKTAKVPLLQLVSEPLSERELEVLRLVAMGMTNGEISERLVVSVGTVKSHVHTIIEKLGVSSRTQAAAKSRELGLL